MQPHAEHEQHHADFGEFRRDLGVGDKAGRVRTYDHAGQQVSDERWQLESCGEKAKHQRNTECRRERVYKRRAMKHRWTRSKEAVAPRLRRKSTTSAGREDASRTARYP